MLFSADIHYQHFDIEKAITVSAQEKGLSGRISLPDNQGMLFIFPSEKILSFWMKEMNFPIDILWLDKNCKIIDISAHQLPCEKNKICPLIRPSKPAQYVLETNIHFRQKYQVKMGEVLSICF